MAEESFNPYHGLNLSSDFPDVIGDLDNDYVTAYPEAILSHRIITSKGVEELIIFTIAIIDSYGRLTDIKNLRYDGRQIVKVIYTNPEGKTIKQAFYRSTGEHNEGKSYKDLEFKINTKNTWVPFDGIGYHDEGWIVSMKRDINRNASPSNLIRWAQRDTALYKCDYFGKQLALDFGEPIGTDSVNIYNSDDNRFNKNHDLVRYGDKTTMRISFLLSSGDIDPPPFWISPLGRRIIETYGFENPNPNYWGSEDPDHRIVEYESQISIPFNYIEANAREVNNFVADFISFNWQDNVRSVNYNETYSQIRRRQNRNYDLRYSYMPTAKRTWVMFDTYLQTNPDSRLPMEAQSLESQKTKQIYDEFDSFDARAALNKIKERK